jgi:hypothetical protein
MTWAIACTLWSVFAAVFIAAISVTVLSILQEMGVI